MPPNFEAELFARQRKIAHSSSAGLLQRVHPVIIRRLLASDNLATLFFVYEQEISKSKYADVYIIGKIIWRSGNRLYLK